MLLHAVSGKVEEGDWLVADRQTGGRGRLGRQWESSKGNLYASTLVRLRRDDPAAPTLALVAGLALVAACPVAVVLKWPNDVLIAGAKIAGILLERQDDAVVIGFGVNVASSPALADRATACLADHTSGGITVDSILVVLVKLFAETLHEWRRQGSGAIIRAWEAAGPAVGTAMNVKLPDSSALNGRFDGLDSSGALRLRLADGQVHVIHAADVALI